MLTQLGAAFIQLAVFSSIETCGVMDTPISSPELPEARGKAACGDDDVQRRLAHPAFPQPARKDRPVWHYMTLAKFIALLDTKALFFCRLDCLADQYEGVLPNRWRGQVRRSAHQAHEADRLRRSCYVNCWN